MESSPEDNNTFVKPKPSLIKLYNFCNNSLKMKNLLCNLFLFKPPNPKGYIFEKNSFKNGEMKLTLFLMEKDEKRKKICVPQKMEVEPFTLSLIINGKICIIPLIYIKNQSADDKFIIIYSHGNASDLGDVYSYILNISIIYRINIVSYDYRGYGISENTKIREKTTFEDLEYVLSFVQERLKYDIRNIILWGFSLGTGPTVELASRYQNLGGVLLQSPLASLMIWMDKNAKWDYDYQENDVYCSINKIDNIKTKIFIIHGKRDKTIDVRHSHLLYEKYVNSAKENNQIWLVIAEGASHNDIQFLIEDNGGPFFKRINKFIDMVKIPFKLDMKNCKNFDQHKGREETRLSFYEKEKNSLKISFKRLLINICEKEDSDIIKVIGKNEKHVIKLKNLNNKDENENIEVKKIISQEIMDNRLYLSKELKDENRPNKIELNEIYEQNAIKKSKSIHQNSIQLFENPNELLIKNYFKNI